MSSSRLGAGEMLAGGGGIAMFAFLFFDWFSGGGELTGSVGSLTVSTAGISGWDALTDVPGFVIMLSGLSGIFLACLAATGKRVNIPIPRGGLTAYLGALAVLLILWRMVAGSPSLRIGIFLGLAAAIAITAGALMALREDGFRALVAVAPASATTAAAASAPAVKPSAPATTTKKSSTKAKKPSAKTKKPPGAKKGSGAGKGSRSSGSKTSSSGRKKK